MRRDVKEAMTEAKIQVRRLSMMLLQGRGAGVFGQKESRRCVRSGLILDMF